MRLCFPDVESSCVWLCLCSEPGHEWHWRAHTPLITALCPAACLEGTVFWKMNFWRSVASVSCHVFKKHCHFLQTHPISPAKRCNEYSANLDPCFKFLQTCTHQPQIYITSLGRPLKRDSIYTWEPQQLLS